LYLCGDCGFAQLCDVIRAESIYIDYIYETKSSLGLVEHFRRYAESVISSVAPAPGSLVVDVGSNDGTLLRFFKEHGFRVLGVDPAREIARDATQSGIETLPAFFTAELSRSIRQARGPAEIITANNIFANVDDLDELMVAIRSLLSDDGVFVFESYYLGDLIKNMVFDFIYHEHLSSFSVTPLVGFFRRHGMQLIDADRVATKGGSLRYTVQLSSGRRPVQNSIRQLLEDERRQGLGQLETFEAFRAKIAEAKATLLELLASVKAQGKTIAGYGASATTTTLLYHFGLKEYLSFLVDEYARKQNIYSPGLQLPVLTPQALIDRHADYTVILAWRYVEPIVSKNGAYLGSGGKFVVPLPELSVI